MSYISIEVYASLDFTCTSISSWNNGQHIIDFPLGVIQEYTGL